MGNIVSGHELISRMGLEEVYGTMKFYKHALRNTPCNLWNVGLTIPLVTSESGSKLGKTAGNAVWITPSKTSPYELYQFFMRMKDSEVENLLRLFTFLTLDEILCIMEQQSVSSSLVLLSPIKILYIGFNRPSRNPELLIVN